MRRSKTIYLFNILLCIFLIFYVKNYSYKSKYTDEKEVIGIITKIVKKDNNVKITLKAKEKLILNCYECQIEYKVGDIVKFKGYFQEIKENSNFNLFDYKKYLMSLKIYKNFVFKESEYIKTSNNVIYKIHDFLDQKTSNFKSTYFLKAMILGDTSEFADDNYNSYKENGIVHLFAISGMHVGIISSLLVFLLKKIFKLNKTSYLIIYPILIIYMLIINSASIIRSVLMFIATTLKNLLKIKISSINILYYIFVANLIINPYSIYNMGFCLSYTIAFFLILSSKEISKIDNYFLKMLYLSIISFLASLPIIINNNFEFNLLTPIINVFIVPFVSIILFPLSLLTFLIPFLDDLLFTLLNGFNNLNMFLSNNSIIILVGYINIYLIMLYYLLFLLVLIKPKLIYLGLIYFMFLINIKNLDFNTYLTMLDVGQGDSIVIKNYSGENILIDVGSKESSAGNVIIPYLKSIGISKIDKLIISHGDSDHIAAGVNLVNNFKVENVIFNCGPFNNLERELVEVLDSKNIEYSSCIDELNVNDQIIYFLNTRIYNNENDNSNVVLMKIGSYRFLFMGDAEKAKELDLIAKYDIGDIDVLKVGHHGSKTSSTIELINEIKPKYSIISVGKNNRYGHPNKEAIDNLKESKIYRTDEDGSIMFKIKNNKLQIETCSP